MPLLRMNATDRGLTLHRDEADALLQVAEASHGSDGPAIIMIHGYKYDPDKVQHCPHRKLFGAEGANWPRELGFGQSGTSEGLGIALGWPARGTLRQIHRRANALGAALAELVDCLKATAPNRPVHVIAHSLGSEIALAALKHLPAQAVNRMLLLTGASFSGFANDMLATPAGRTAEVFNITSRENDIFDLAFETLLGAQRRGDRAIGEGLMHPNVLNIQLDCHRSLAALARVGSPISPPARQICHWSTYKRPGAMTFYNKLLRQPETHLFDDLRAHLPDELAPRWSRLGLGATNLCSAQAQSFAAATQRLRRKVALLKRASADRETNEPVF